MLTLYIACLLFGGVLMLVSLFAGGDSSGDGDMVADHDVHALDSHGADMDSGHDVVTTDHAGDHVHAHEHVSVEAVKFLSFRNFVFFSGFFGLTGTALTLLAMPFLLTLVSSAGVGLLSAQVGYRFLRYLKRTESGQAIHLNELQGRTGRVLVGCSKQHPGKISLTAGGQVYQLVARASEDASRSSFKPGETVIISHIEQGIAYVIEGNLLP